MGTANATPFWLSLHPSPEQCVFGARTCLTRLDEQRRRGASTQEEVRYAQGEAEKKEHKEHKEYDEYEQHKGYDKYKEHKEYDKYKEHKEYDKYKEHKEHEKYEEYGLEENKRRQGLGKRAHTNRACNGASMMQARGKHTANLDHASRHKYAEYASSLFDLSQ